MTEQPTPATAAPGNSTLQTTKTIVAIITMSLTAVGIVVLLVIAVSLYPSLRATAINMEKASEAVAESAENFSNVSDETSQNLVSTSENFNQASMNFSEASANFHRNSLDDNMAETIIRVLEGSGDGSSR